MRILDLLAGLYVLCLADIVLTKLLLDVFLRIFVRFLRDSCRICTQVCNQTDRAHTLDLHTFIQLLCDTHRLIGCKIQLLSSFLLQRTCCKRKWLFLRLLTYLYLRNCKWLSVNFFLYLIKFFFFDFILRVVKAHRF